MTPRYFSTQSSPTPVSVKMSPSKPAVWLSSCRVVICAAAASSYRRLTHERWERVRDGWPEPASTIAPLLCAGMKGGELWAADERGLHRSDDGGTSWRRIVSYVTAPQHLRALAVVR